VDTVSEHPGATPGDALELAGPAPGPRARALLELVEARLGPEGRAWLRSAAGLDAPLDRDAFTGAFTAAARRVGRAAAGPSAEALPRLRAGGVAWPVDGWGLDELARVALLLRAAEATAPGAFEALVSETYEHGDSRERQAVLRGLALLPAPERFLSLAIEACRSSIQPLFEAIACENPYPAAHFPEPSFNQMVLKALFTGVALRRVLGLAGRITPELARMAADYASERRAAGRSVPADIGGLVDAQGAAS
jgi:hypothetical protein